MARDTRTKNGGKDKLLAPGINCWRVARSDRCSLLVDGEAYFKAVRNAIGNARRAVWILGWDIDSRIGLVRGDGEEPSGPCRSFLNPRSTQSIRGPRTITLRFSLRAKSTVNPW